MSRTDSKTLSQINYEKTQRRFISSRILSGPLLGLQHPIIDGTVLCTLVATNRLLPNQKAQATMNKKGGTRGKEEKEEKR